jgi:putative transposase
MYKKQKQYRLFGFDYSRDGYYFVTIVTKDRFHDLGVISNKEMKLSTQGDIVYQHIYKFLETSEQNPYIINQLPTIFTITSYAILPNHVHIIVQIRQMQKQAYTKVEGLRPLVKGSLSLFINQFKGRIKRQCHESGYTNFHWQSRFHDRIIRDQTEYDRIEYYIESNVENWDSDSENL